MANKNYPHPVLNAQTDDFIHKKAKFDIQISQKIDGMNYKLLCNVDLSENNLEDLLALDLVAFAVKVVCSTTRYRRVFQFNSLENVITLPSSYVEKKVEISTYIIATNAIDSYSSQAFHDDYEGASFSIFQGDILAEGSEYTLNVEKKIDPLVKVPSIFTIVFNDDKKTPPIDVRSSEDKIIITLDKANFNKYKMLKQLQNQYGQLAALTSSLFILPAFVVILDDIRKDLANLQNNADAIKDYIEEKVSEHRWFKVINTKLKESKFDLTEPDNIMESSLVIAQKLLGNPLSNGLEFFDELFGSKDEEEETV
ncbi:hypothetical protein ACQKP0_15925 [Heyndrickxia sp. NPDC080065]|uniref:hypothetical protein n=1 Tax=Heyndrickxia sp. NPDC080065 TaxID=3390568 RepID=UPI003D073A24